MSRLAIVSSHPIQYNAPLFKLLAQTSDVVVKVFYTLGRESSGFIDPGFKKTISWDVPLLEGYDYTFVKNTSKKPSSAAFKGIINPTLLQELKYFGATHILVYGWCFQSHLKVLHYFHGKVKILFRGDSTLLDEKPGLKSLARRAVLSWVYRHIDIALYVGRNNKAYYLKHGVPEHKLVFAPHAIDNDRFKSFDEAKVQKLREQFGIDPDKKVLIFAGKFEWKKNPVLLVDAFKQIESTDTILLMIGNGALESKLKQLANGDDRIIFMPFQNQSVMPVVYRLGDILVLPSVTETWGLCMNEAMACGLGIFASNKTGGALDLIEIGRNGYIFDSGNLSHLIKVFKKVIEMPKQELKNMGALSQEKIKDWGYQQTQASILNILKNN